MQFVSPETLQAHKILRVLKNVKLDRAMKIELGVLGAALFSLGAFVAMQAAGASTPAADPVDRFTERDFAAFDRSFKLNGEACAVGLKDRGLCFGSSPYEPQLIIGEALDPQIPLLSAEFAVIVETDLKTEGLSTVRFGQTLLLIDPETREVVDMMRLNAPSLTQARLPATLRANDATGG